MNTSRDRKSLAKDKMHIAIENLKQAELEGAEELAPHTHTWAKTKIYEDRKIILNSNSKNSEVEEAADDASAASAQLLSIVRRHERDEKKDSPMPDVMEKEAINNLVNEGGPVV